MNFNPTPQTMSQKCYARWTGQITQQSDHDATRVWVLKCRTCGLELENGRVPKRCGLDTFYAHRAARNMGTHNAELWEVRRDLSAINAHLKADARRSAADTPSAAMARKRRAALLADLRKLMQAKHDENDPINRWDEVLRSGKL